jgi:uncharacterized protein YprB with RNaseH-like and TPR domain
MRDLTSRLRDIVRQPVAARATPSATTATRELTYVPDLPTPAVDLDRVAELLGGTRHDAPGSSCIVIDRTWEPHEWHGRKCMDAYAINPASPVALFDSRLAGLERWDARVVFFDIETTGLSGGAGTLPLIVGCGWFDGPRFVVRQYFLSGPAGERAMLDALTEVMDEASLLVTYNGRTFDVPVMETRWAFHRRQNGSDDLPHLDMLPTARKLWGRTGPSCTLTALERSVLRFHRLNDVPGLEIPSRYFQFLRTGDPSVIEGVLEHNRHDIVSLAAVTAHALQLAVDGPEACENRAEAFGLGCLYERAGEIDRAEAAFAMAAGSEDEDVAVHALTRLAILLRRRDRHDDAASAWEGVLAISSGRPHLDALHQRAAEALAIHCEHRSKELVTAKTYAETLRKAAPRLAAAADHRIQRLDRKLKRAPLFTP